MDKLEWDAEGQRLYEVGVDRGVLYVYNKNATGMGAKSSKYVGGVAWNGLTAVNESPSGAESSKIFADNITYLNIISKEEFGATIEAYTYPDAFGECDGSYAPLTGLRFGQQGRKSFGFSYRTIVGNDVDREDYGYKIHLIYGAMASPSEKSHATINENIEPGTMSWEVTTTPVNVDDIGNKKIKPLSSIEINSVDYWDETKQKYDDGFLALEEALYGKNEVAAVGTEGEAGYVAGTPGVTPWLPLPNDVYDILNGTRDSSGNVISS